MNRTQTIRLVTVLVAMSITCGCDIFGGGGTAFDKMAADRLHQRLTGGEDPASALRALSEELGADPDVAAVVLDEGKAELWIVYKSGEQVVLDVETIDAGFDDTVDFGGFDGANFIDGAAKTIRVPSTTQQTRDALVPGLTTPPYVFPETNKALLINAIQSCVEEIRRSGYDTTKGVARQLQKVGYAVDRSNGSLDAFLKLTDYSVVFIEARTSTQTAPELLIVLTALPDVTEPRPANSSVEGSSELITTSTVVTDALRAQYADDLRFGRLKIRRSWYVFRGQVTRCDPTFAVTPDFIRQHISGRFPGNILLYISAGGLVDTTKLTSQWQALLAEKSDSGHFVSWVGAPKYPVTKLAAANFFGLLSGADNRFKLISNTTTLPDGRVLNDVEFNGDAVYPPLANLGMTPTMAALNLGGDAVDLDTGAFLWRTSHGPQTDITQFALAPLLDDFHVDALNRAQARGGAPAGSQCRFTDAGVGYDLGPYGPPGLDNAGISFGGVGYHFNLPVGIAGRARLQDATGRHSSERTVFTWKPLLSVTGEGPNGEQYTMSFQFVARAVPAPRSRGVVNPIDVYSVPRNNAFDGRFDGTASTVAWSVSGHRTVGQYQYDYSGGGLAALVFMDGDGNPVNAMFSTTESEGAFLTIDVAIQAEMSFTETRTDTSNNQITVTERTLPIPTLVLENLNIDNTLTLAGGNRPVSTSENGWTATANWSAAAPSPAFSVTFDRR